MTTIKGLYFIWNESHTTPYLQAISLNENILNNFTLPFKDLNKDTWEDGVIVIKDVDFYTITHHSDNLYFINKIVPLDDQFVKDNTYVMNLEEGNYINQVLVKFTNNIDPQSLEKNDNIFKDEHTNQIFNLTDLSNPVELDFLYDEGIINA